MTEFRLLPFALVMAAILGSCTSGNDIAVIPVDIDSAAVLEIDPEALVALETSDSSMIYDINSMEIVGNRFVVHSRDYLKTYDRHTGAFKGNVARRGKADGDFSYIGNIWLQGDTICVFDTNSRTINRYSADGEFYGSDKPFDGLLRPGSQPRQYYELHGEGVFTANLSSDNTTGRNPRFTFYGYGREEGQEIDGREITEPTFLTDGTVVDYDDRRLLSWEPLRDTIFELTASGVRPLYHVDFGLNSLPSEVQNLKYLSDRAAIFNKGNDPAFASLVRYVQPHEGKLYFSFVCSDGRNFLACFDKLSGTTAVKHISAADGAYSQTSFFRLVGDSAYVEVRDRQRLFANSLIYQIPISEIQ